MSMRVWCRKHVHSGLPRRDNILSIILQNCIDKGEEMVGNIKRLEESVVNKIAAGEIIISPVNALKEMMENSIDAGAKTLDILVRDGGIKLLQITDNGSGIQKEDLPILCERFTTSKLKTFEDLESISTYGFRGEALASISHIARVTITTKTFGDKCAWKATYSEGRMLEDPKPVAGKEGTVILVEDLFYNMPSRLQALRSSSEEYAKILDVVGRYAVHSENIGFSCKKFGDSQFALTVRMEATKEDRIRIIFGNSISKNLTDLEIGAQESLDIIGVSGKVSKADFSSKKSVVPVFFINNRLVSCNPLARALRQVYANYLPKGNKPFIYVSILIDPKSVDVNVHPTKREVRFLHQDQIIEKITTELNENLSQLDMSRTFKASAILTGNPLGNSTNTLNKNDEYFRNISVSHNSGHVQKYPPSSNVKKYENKLVRTDAAQAKITSFLQSGAPKIVGSQSEDVSREYDGGSEPIREPESSQVQKGYRIVAKKRINVNLTSIKRLREAVDNSSHRELTNIFANLTYVGIVDEERRLATIQHDLKLFLVDYGAISYNLFYQICLTDFSNYGKIELHSDIKCHLTIVGLLSAFEQLTEEKTTHIVKTLWEMRDMLNEYFSIDISGDDNDEEPAIDSIKISSLPLLLKGYTPPLSKLPLFLYRLGTKIEWEEEEPCLDGIMKQIALLYIPEIIEKIDNSNEASEEARVIYVSKSEQMSSTLEDVIFPCVKRRFLAPRDMLKDVIEIANLPGLYKVFERC